MNDTLAALKAEIEAAEKKRAYAYSMAADVSNPKGYAYLIGYLDGLQTAVRLLEKEQPQELPY